MSDIPFKLDSADPLRWTCSSECHKLVEMTGSQLKFDEFVGVLPNHKFEYHYNIHIQICETHPQTQFI